MISASLPKKKGLSKSLGKDVINERRKDLELYIKNLLEIKLLGENIYFIAFLQQNKSIDLRLQTVRSNVMNNFKFDPNSLDVPTCLKLLSSSFSDPSIRSNLLLFFIIFFF